jgi:guanylate kinase
MILREGLPIVISGPSGSGKTTLCHRLIETYGGMEFSVSHTTRPMRPGETHGVDYHFVSKDMFEADIQKNAFLEWAQVFNHHYGTHWEEITTRIPQGVDVLFDIDIQGGKQILEKLPQAVLIFILPPSLAVLEQRLRARKTDAENVIQQRLHAATQEIMHATFYHHWVVNEDLHTALEETAHIVETYRNKAQNKHMLMQKIIPQCKILP